MTSIVYFDYCALVIEILVFLSMYIRNLFRGRINRWAIAMMAVLIITTIADTIAYTLEGTGTINIPLSFVTNTISLWGTANFGILFCGYLFAQVGVWNKVNEVRWIKWGYYIPLTLISIILLIVNPFVHIIFHIDDAGIYTRDAGYGIFYGLALLYIVVGYVVLFKFRRMFNLQKIISIVLVMFMGLIGSIIQVAKPEFVVQMFFVSCGLLILVFGVQTPEERIHGTTGLLSQNAYFQDINKYTMLKSKVGITLAVLANYDALIEMLGYFKVQKITIDTSDRLKKWARKNKIDADIYYLGGGRFSVIVDERYDDEQIHLAQELNAILNEEYDVDEMQVKVMYTCCFISYPKDIDSPAFLFAFDEKLAGEVYSGELRYAEKLFDKKSFELGRAIGKILDRAFSDNLFSIHYQPVYSVEADRFVSCEAFLRLNDPEFGAIPPDVLIREAEKSNSIHAITAYVIEEVCKFVTMPEFLLLGFDYVEINLSPVQCMWNDLLAVLLSTMKIYNAQSKHICFNITDVENIKTYEKMRDNIAALSQIGFKIYMDDFGAGIFEIERIAEMPLSGIKLDRDFVRLGLSDQNSVVFEGTLRMIKDIGIDAVIVGVENDEMVKKLKDLNCKFLQGYSYCKPLERTELTKFILLG